MTNLTPEEINRILAKWMGWIPDHGYTEMYDTPFWRDTVTRVVVMEKDLPKYTESLDRVATIEAKLTDEQHWKFRAALWEATYTSDDRINGELHNRQYASATAFQKATALVRSLNLKP